MACGWVSPLPSPCSRPPSSQGKSHRCVLIILTFFAVLSSHCFHISSHSVAKCLWSTYNSVLTLHSFMSSPALAKPVRDTHSAPSLHLGGRRPGHSRQRSIGSPASSQQMCAAAPGVAPSFVALQLFFSPSISVLMTFDQNDPTVTGTCPWVMSISSSQEPSPVLQISAGHTFQESVTFT